MLPHVIPPLGQRVGKLWPEMLGKRPVQAVFPFVRSGHGPGSGSLVTVYFRHSDGECEVAVLLATMIDVELHGGRQHNVALDAVLTAPTVIRRDDDEMPDVLMAP